MNKHSTVPFLSGGDLKAVLLFPGQGSQYMGMCRPLISEYPYIKIYFDEASELLGFDLLGLCLHGPEEKLNLTSNAQPLILSVSFCAFQILRKEYQIKPYSLAGHSLGEISALCCSGAISFGDAIQIVRKRGELMQQAAGLGAGSMMALNGLPVKQVENLLSMPEFHEKAVISNINSETQVVVSGEKDTVLRLGLEAKKLGAITIPLKVSAPFHSHLMKPAANEFEKVLSNYSYSSLNYPVMSNVRNKPYQNEKEIIPLLTEQVTAPVNWLKISDYINRTNADCTLELPPGKTLTKFFKKEGQQKHFVFSEIGH